jgi:nitrate/nitrite-specific signal transduction histidine kinase
MKERTGQLHGTLTVRSARGQGTTVAIRIPYRAAAGAGARSGPA